MSATQESTPCVQHIQKQHAEVGAQISIAATTLMHSERLLQQRGKMKQEIRGCDLVQISSCRTGAETIAFYFPKFDDPSSLPAESTLRSLLYQALQPEKPQSDSMG